MVDALICAIVVVEAGKIRFQKFNGNPKECREEDGTWKADGPNKQYGLAPVTKSITSTLPGHVIAKKMKATTRADFEAVLEGPVDRLIDELGKGSSRGGYAGVPLQRVLSMRSNVRWREIWLVLGQCEVQEPGQGLPIRQAGAQGERRRVRRRYAPRRTGKPEFNYSGLDAAVAAAAPKEFWAARS